MPISTLQNGQASKSQILKRMGTISPDERAEIEIRLKYSLNLSEDPGDDWFTQNASPELLKKVFSGLDRKQQEDALSGLLDLL